MKKIFIYSVLVIFSLLLIIGCSSENQQEVQQQEQSPTPSQEQEEKQADQEEPIEEDTNSIPPSEEVQNLPITDQEGQPNSEIQVTASKFKFEPNPIIVKKGQETTLIVTSTDIAHGIAIPEFGINRELPPKETITIKFIPDKVGEFPVFCSVFCGSGHSSMDGKLVVEEKRKKKKNGKLTC